MNYDRKKYMWWWIIIIIIGFYLEEKYFRERFEEWLEEQGIWKKKD